MWPEDEEDDELDEVEEDDEDAVIERVEAAFRQEYARIRGATSREWLHRLRANYEAEIADLALVGVAAARAHDLIDLIYERLAELEAAEQRRLRVAEDAAAAARQRAELAARERRHREEAARRQTEERDRREQRERERARPKRAAADRRGQDRARQADAEQKAAAARLANAQAAEIEARAALLRAQAARAERQQASQPARAAARGDAARSGPAVTAASTLERAVSEPIGEEAEGMSPMDRADRDALFAVGRWPPPSRDSLFWSPDAGWPKDWTLKGFDLASLRGRLGVTQAVMAGHLGVPTVEVARAEADPREKVRPALQVALIRAIGEFLAANAPRAVVAPPTPEQAVVAAAPALTGADLARYREAHGFTQRQAAERLGVAHGTVAKAELLPAQPLGDRLQEALQAALRK